MGVQSPLSANGARALDPATAGVSSSLAVASPAQFRHARVALLSTWHPEPADNGRKQRTRIIIDALYPKVEIILISLIDDTLEGGGPLPAVPGVSAQYALPMPRFDGRSLAGLAGALSRRPRSVNATWSKRTSDRINQIADRHKVDLAIGTDLRALPYLTALPAHVKRILDEPDVSPFATDAIDSGTARGLRARLRERKYRHFLRAESLELDGVVVASQREAHVFQRMAGKRATVIANGVAALPEQGWNPSGRDSLLFTGSLRYRPNLDGVAYFVEHVLPKLKQEHPGAHMIVTGDPPDPLPSAARDPGVMLTGRLESLDEHYRTCRLFVAPLLSGTGTRVKLLEAMAYGMPIVSTSKGAEGLPVKHGEHLLIADDPDEFAAAVLRLLSDRDRCLRLGARARELVAQRFLSAAIGEDWRRLIGSAIEDQKHEARHGQ